MYEKAPRPCDVWKDMMRCCQSLDQLVAFGIQACCSHRPKKLPFCFPLAPPSAPSDPSIFTANVVVFLLAPTVMNQRRRHGPSTLPLALTLAGHSTCPATLVPLLACKTCPLRSRRGSHRICPCARHPLQRQCQSDSDRITIPAQSRRRRSTYGETSEPHTSPGHGHRYCEKPHSAKTLACEWLRLSMDERTALANGLPISTT